MLGSHSGHCSSLVRSHPVGSSPTPSTKIYMVPSSIGKADARLASEHCSIQCGTTKLLRSIRVTSLLMKPHLLTQLQWAVSITGNAPLLQRGRTGSNPDVSTKYQTRFKEPCHKCVQLVKVQVSKDHLAGKFDTLYQRQSVTEFDGQLCKRRG